MRSFNVQGIDLAVPQSKAFSFIADPAKLPKWTSAFASVSSGRAVMRTPNGEVTIALEVDASAEQGTVDWRMTFPDDSVATAASEAYHKARARGVDMRFVVQPGRAGGYYHMAGLEMNIPTYSRLTGAIEI